MWLVGYLYNNNGMGTWCWEAAHALAEAGEDVTLVCSSTVVLPGVPRVPVLRVDPPPLESTRARLIGDGGLLSAHGPRVMRAACALLQSRGSSVQYLLLNSTEFYDAAIARPQLVVAWARGVRLVDYLVRHLRQAHPNARERLRSLLGTIGWWRRDWHAYRRASLVLPVTRPLLEELQQHRVHAALLHPCVDTVDALSIVAYNPVRLVTAAADLEDPRKQVAWMLTALRQSELASVSLALVGTFGERIRALVDQLPFPATLLGALPREQALAVMREHDVFLFASSLDDWGYVVTEAMAAGLAVVAPDSLPFGEILGDTGAQYAPGDSLAFVRATGHVVEHVGAERERSLQRARGLFSRSRFAERLRDLAAREL